MSDAPDNPPRRPKKFVDDFIPLYDPVAIIDHSVDLRTILGHLVAGEPCVYAKAGEGEFRTALGFAACASTHWLLPGMAEHMRQSLKRFAVGRDSRVYVALHEEWYQQEIQPFVVEHGLLERMHWVSQSIWQRAIANFALLEFVGYLKTRQTWQYFLPKPVVVGNVNHVPLAESICGIQVQIPPTDCYLNYYDILRECRRLSEERPRLFLFMAGPVSELLIADLYKEHPEHVYLDCGHIWDAMMPDQSMLDIRSSYSTKRSDSVMRLLEQVYRPLFREHWESKEEMA